MVIQEPERRSSYLALVGVKLGGSRLDQEDFGIRFSLYFRSIVKDQIVWYAQVHNTHTFQVYWFSDFGLTDLGFHEQIESKQVYIV